MKIDVALYSRTKGIFLNFARNYAKNLNAVSVFISVWI